MQPSSSGGRKHRGDNERCELQHSGHVGPPDLAILRNRTIMANLNILIIRDLQNGALRICAVNYTACRAGRALLIL